MSRGRLFAACSVRPWHAVDGYALRVRALLEHLGRDWSIHLAAPGEPPEGATLADLGVDTFTSIPMAPRDESSILGMGGSEPEAARRLHRILASESFDALLLWPGAEFLVFEGGPWPPAVCDRIDSSTFAFLRGLRDLGDGPTWRSRLSRCSDILASWSYERRLLAHARATVMVGEDDARAMRRIRRRARVCVIPNGVALRPLEELPGEAAVPTVIFTGVLCYPPNEAAAEYFARRVMPRVRERIGDARFCITGRDASPRVRALEAEPGVVLRENVPDMAEELAAAWVAVAPMLSGAGIKNKTLEAWALAKPVVMTTLASNGLVLNDALACCVVDSPAAMAERVVALLESRDERRRIGGLGHALVRTHHDWHRAARALGALLAGDAIAPGATEAA